MKCQLQLQAVMSAEDHRDPVVLSRAAELPFTPFAGLALYGLLTDPEEQVFIENVAFDVIGEVFWCELEDDQYVPENEEEGNEELSFDEKIAAYGEEWEVAELDEE